jgi:Mg-chelatase subunit ChlD
MMKRKVLLGLYLMLVLCGEILAENRKVVLVLDVSGSMNEGKKFQAVQSYIEKDLFPSLIQPNDQFTLILFGNNPRVAFTERIIDENSRKELLERIRKLKADDDYTDIGMALEYLFDQLSRMKGEGDVKVIFITDGKNTPPRDSPYYGKDLSVDTRFREIGKKISQEGWFIYVIGIGKETDAKHIATVVEGSVLRETDAALKDVRVEEYVQRTAEARKAREDAGRKTGMEEPSSSTIGVSALIHQWSLALGIPTLVLYGVFLLILAGALAWIGYLLWKVFRPMQILVWDSQLGRNHAFRISLAIGSPVTFNTPSHHLPVLGGEEHPAIQIGRTLTGVWIRILDGTLVGDSSPYQDKEKHPLRKRALELASGEQVFIL